MTAIDNHIPIPQHLHVARHHLALIAYVRGKHVRLRLVQRQQPREQMPQRLRQVEHRQITVHRHARANLGIGARVQRVARTLSGRWVLRVTLVNSARFDPLGIQDVFNLLIAVAHF